MFAAVPETISVLVVAFGLSLLKFVIESSVAAVAGETVAEPATVLRWTASMDGSFTAAR